MKLRTKHHLAYAFAGCVLVGSVGFLAWAFVTPVELKVGKSKPQVSSAPIERLPFPSAERLQKLAAKRLQGALAQTVAAKPKPKPKITPPFTLHTIFFGPKSKLAVFQYQNKRTTLKVGESLAGAKLTKVTESYVDVIYQGQACRLAPQSKFPTP